MTYATLSVCVPLLVYLVASLNPSSWAVTGVMVAWFGTYAAFSKGPPLIKVAGLPRIIIPASVALIGAAMASLARSDAGVYIVFIALVLTVQHFAVIRKKLWLLALPGLMAIMGLWSYFSAHQISYITGGGSGPATGGGIFTNLAQNLVFLPRLLIDYSAAFMGLNWLDTWMPPLVWVAVLLVSFGLMASGLRKMDLKKWVVAGLVIGAYAGLPLLTLQASGYLVGESVQPRYIAPLIALVVATLIWRPKTGGTGSMSLAQTIFAYLLLVAAHAVALNVQIRRFISGMGIKSADLRQNIDWWHAGPSPMATWLLGSCGFAILALALFVVRRDQQPEPVAGIAEATVEAPVEAAHDALVEATQDASVEAPQEVTADSLTG
jgi:hypothetical protein